MNNIKNPKISVIINCYNQEETITDILLSVLNQTYTNIETIIINDGSEDNSSEKIKCIADKYKNIIFFDEKEHKGEEYNIQWAKDATNGEHIIILNSKQVLDLNYIERKIKNLAENTEKNTNSN